MRRTVLLVAAVLVVTAVAPATAVAQSEGECTFPYERVDATGETVNVTEEPGDDSVVTLNPSAAQTMWEIGARDKVVGVSKYASYLEGAAAKENISAGGQTVSNEAVVGLQPDLVLAPNTITNDTVGTLRSTGLTVYRFPEAESIEDIERKTRITGSLVGECAGASETVAWMDSRLVTVDEAVADADRPGVLYTFFGTTPGRNTFINTLIERAGGRNVAAEAGIEGYEPISSEVVVNRTVEWIVRNSAAPTVPDSAAYENTSAIEGGNVVVVDENYVSQPAPRVVYVVETMAKAFHPEAYAAANATATPTTTATSTASAGEMTPTTDDPGPTDTPTPTDAAEGPGFGVAAAILALLAAVVAIRVRR